MPHQQPFVNEKRVDEPSYYRMEEKPSKLHTAGLIGLSALTVPIGAVLGFISSIPTTAVSLLVGSVCCSLGIACLDDKNHSHRTKKSFSRKAFDCGWDAMKFGGTSMYTFTKVGGLLGLVVADKVFPKSHFGNWIRKSHAENDVFPQDGKQSGEKRFEDNTPQFNSNTKAYNNNAIATTPIDTNNIQNGYEGRRISKTYSDAVRSNTSLSEYGQSVGLQR